MAITRTAKGTAKNKTGASTLTISSVVVDAGSVLILGLSYDNGNHPVSVNFGTQKFRPVRNSLVTANGISTRLYKRNRRKTDTQDFVVTWEGSIPTAKAMFLTQVSEAYQVDIKSSSAQSTTTTPHSGAAQTSNEAVSFFIGAMGSEGPNGDDAGTPSNSYTAGQRDGTVGAPPGSNITIQEIFKIVSSTESTRARLSGVTERDWACSFAAFYIPYKIINIVIPEAWDLGPKFVTEWWIFENETWDVEDLRDNILSHNAAETPSNWKLEEGGADMTNTDLCWDVLVNQDTVTVIAV